MASIHARYIVTGLFESAKRYWSVAVFGKIAVGVIGFVVAVRPQAASISGMAILGAEIVSAMCFYRADALKSRAEPVLTRLDLEESLGWSLPKEFCDELQADSGIFLAEGKRTRADDPYFAPGNTAVGWQRLRKNLSESALYSRSIAADARNVILGLFVVLLCVVVAVLASGLYRQLFQGANAGGEFLVDALLLIVTIDLLPLALQYNTLRCDATRTRDQLAALPLDPSEALLMPIALDYQLARAVAPLLPTFAFLKKRFPLGTIWSSTE